MGHSAMRFHLFPVDDVESVRVMLHGLITWNETHIVRRRSLLSHVMSATDTKPLPYVSLSLAGFLELL